MYFIHAKVAGNVVHAFRLLSRLFVRIDSFQLRLQLLICSLVKVQLILVAGLVGLLDSVRSFDVFNRLLNIMSVGGLIFSVWKSEIISCSSVLLICLFLFQIILNQTCLSFCLFSTICIVNLRSETWKIRIIIVLLV